METQTFQALMYKEDKIFFLRQFITFEMTKTV